MEALIVKNDKWFKTWRQIGERIRRLPEEMQVMVLEDVLDAIQNRVKTVERIMYEKP